MRRFADPAQSGLPVLYVDEKAGSDSTGTGAELAPFATLLAAYQSLSPSASSDASPTTVATFLLRKTDSVEHNEWVPISGSAGKRLLKGIEIWRKKETKRGAEGEKLEREKREGEERDRKRREEAKGVVLVDDSSKGEALRVSQPVWYSRSYLSARLA